MYAGTARAVIPRLLERLRNDLAAAVGTYRDRVPLGNLQFFEGARRLRDEYRRSFVAVLDVESEAVGI
jgi:hypothetical protein